MGPVGNDTVFAGFPSADLKTAIETVGSHSSIDEGAWSISFYSSWLNRFTTAAARLEKHALWTPVIAMAGWVVEHALRVVIPAFDPLESNQSIQLQR
ncbi:hypothetical protein L2E82_15050 [Cichorium intybus]|uniref:Uncharacterized protein n=1 Tax=Cichorium intybus TaxID=13427 RepID=A0ACB9F1D2_CICIN|nr:hypothetical protein L2E82_15050 [Cichorium intybus]